LGGVQGFHFCHKDWQTAFNDFGKQIACAYSQRNEHGKSREPFSVHFGTHHAPHVLHPDG
jgi:hypothetical protein